MKMTTRVNLTKELGGEIECWCILHRMEKEHSNINDAVAKDVSKSPLH